MKKIKIFLLSIASSIGAFAVDIDVTPGSLEALLEETKGQTELKLNGTIDARDLAALEHLSSDIKTLDMGGVDIKKLTMPSRKYFGRTLFQEGQIPAYAFFKSEVQTIVLPANTSEISEGAFAGSDITEITIPEGVTSIGDYAFYGCPNLRAVSLPSTLVEIGRGAFGNCLELTQLDLSRTVLREIPERAFAGSLSLETVKLPATAGRIGKEAFSHTAISTLDLGGVAEFEEYALSGMPFLKELALNPNAEVSEGLLMDDTSLESLSGVPQYLPDYFAANCGNLSASAIETAVGVGKYSLANVLAPEILILPETFTSIDHGALYGLNALQRIDATQLGGNVPEADALTFEGLDQPKIELVVADNHYDTWKNAPYWNEFLVKSTSQTGVTAIDTAPEDEVRISIAGGTLVAESAGEIDDLRIYTADGRIVYVASPMEERVEVSLQGMPRGVLVAAVSDRLGNSRTVSFLLK